MSKPSSGGETSIELPTDAGESRCAGVETLVDALAASQRAKGRCVQTLHVFGDGLWRQDGRQMPNRGFVVTEEGKVIAWGSSSSGGTTMIAGCRPQPSTS